MPDPTDDIPTATWEGSFTLMGVAIRCYVVNGQRIINADDFHDWLFAMQSGLVCDPAELERFAKWRAGID